MKTPEENALLNDIQQDLLKEFLKEKCTVVSILEQEVSRAEFRSAKYKDRGSYERVISLKRCLNILKRFIEVSTHEKLDCPPPKVYNSEEY